MSTELKQYEERLNIFLADAFRKYGVECEIENNWLIFKDSHITAQAKAREMTGSSATILHLNVTMNIGLNNQIVESCVGVGLDVEGAIADGWRFFLNTTFHVFLREFFKIKSEKEVEIHKWHINNRQYEVLISPIDHRGQLPSPLPLEWYHQLEELVKEQPLTPGIHWVHLFYAQSAREIIACEIMFDNKIWTEVEADVRKFDFPRGNDFIALHVFILLEDSFDINRAAAIIGRVADRGSDGMIKQLTTDGMYPHNAEKATVFIPLAFGRVYLKKRIDIEFQNEVTILDESQNETTIDLNDDTIYSTAYNLAEEILDDSESVNQSYLDNIINLSSEVIAYKKAIDDGKKKEELTSDDFKLPAIYLPLYNKVEKTEQTEKNQHEEVLTKKKSWKFWKK